MYDPHERILQKLAETGQKEFSTEMIKEAMDKVEEEDLDSMYKEWLKGEEAHTKERAQWVADENTIDRIERSQHEAAQPTSWEEATQDLGDLPQCESSRETEMER